MSRNVEEDFLQAHQRLMARTPMHEKLRARVVAGKQLMVNQTTVSLEAGHSRTLISQRAPGYERICALLYPDEILRDEKVVVRKSASSETSEKKIARLTSENRMLTQERDQFATRLAEAYVAIQLKEREVAALKAEVHRREKNSLELDKLLE